MIRQIRALLLPAEMRAACWLIVLAVIGMVLEILGIGMVIPLLMAVSGAIGSAPPMMLDLLGWLTPGESDLQTRLGLVVMVFVVYALKSVFLAFLAYRQTRFSFGVAARLSDSIFLSSLMQPYEYHLRSNSSDGIRTATNDVSIFTHNVLLPGLYLISELLVLMGLVALLLYVEPYAALIVVLVFGTAGSSFYLLTRQRTRKWGETRQLEDGLRIRHLQQGLGGIKSVKLLGHEESFLAAFSRHNGAWARANQWQAFFMQLPRLWFELLAVAALTLMLFVMMSRAGSQPPDVVAVLGLFAAAAFRLLPSANRTVSYLQSLRYGVSATATLVSECAHPTAMSSASPVTRLPFANAIRLSGVSYGYPGAGRLALREIDLTIPRGSFIGFIGQTGSGKSTLVDVIMGLLQPSRGDVLVDGISIAGRVRDWQRLIGYVPQDIFLTDESLRRNIAFGLPDDEIDEAAVQAAAVAAQLADFIASLPEGLDTRVGERGISLSGGQRQRIGIARALYHNPEVLVLDEATSALDDCTEREVMKTVMAMHGTKTIVAIAHRLSTLRDCDRIYQFADGALVASGRPDEVIN